MWATYPTVSVGQADESACSASLTGSTPVATLVVHMPWRLSITGSIPSQVWHSFTCGFPPKKYILIWEEEIYSKFFLCTFLHGVENAKMTKINFPPTSKHTFPLPSFFSILLGCIISICDNNNFLFTCNICNVNLLVIKSHPLMLGRQPRHLQKALPHHPKCQLMWLA